MQDESAIEVDVAIIGAGAAGCLLAVVLGEEGLRVAVLERAASPCFNGADFLKPNGIRVLRRYGLERPIASRGALERRIIQYYHDGAPIIRCDYAAHTDIGHYLIVPYATTMKVLLDRMAQSSRVTLHTGVGAVQARWEGDRVTELELERGGRVRAKVVVGADGVRSVLRASMGATPLPEPYNQDIFMATFPAVPSVLEQNRLYVSSTRRMMYLYPATEELFRVVVSAPVGEGEAVFAGPAAAFVERMREFVTESDDALAAITELSAFSRTPIAYMHVSKYSRGNAVLIGDAAHCGHPVTGQGMSLALEDAEALADALVAWHEGKTSLAGALERYEEVRRPVNERVTQYGYSLLSRFEDREHYISHFDYPLHGGMHGAASP